MIRRVTDSEATPAGSNTLVELVGVRKSYAFGESTVNALDGVDLKIERGSVVVDPRGGASQVCQADTSNVVDAQHGRLACCPSEEVMAMNPAHITGLRDYALASW